jgi:hypothetical protein
MFQLRPIFDGSDKDYISKGSNIRRNIDDFCFVDPSLSYQYLLIKKRTNSVEQQVSRN